MRKVYVVEIGYYYEGGNPVMVFSKHEDAISFADEIERRQKLYLEDEDYVGGDYAYILTFPLDNFSSYNENEDTGL